ncbi:uncharacterized protein LOC34617538 [Cyclospora cayetanensis]|uniref:Uncharacterized protein LOC34617538 n=1 Tax=Cyclospora cayetanensis TaxID=88456 RepID=A0A6P6RPA7_9EIME|nr:uncharacterized protein LOC34617538 [Cyclospora cayetanensis]
MASAIQMMVLNQQGDTLLAVTQTGLCYVWSVDAEALDALQKVMGDALALTPGAAASAAAAAWRGSRNSSLYARRDSFFTSPVGDELLQHGVFEASQVYVHLLLNSPSPRCVLGAEGKGFAVLGAAISGSGSASTSRIGDDLQAVEFLQDGKLVVAAASCPSAYPLGIYETQKGHLLAAFAATAVGIPSKSSSSTSPSGCSGVQGGTAVLLCNFTALALDRSRPPPSVASSTPATAVAKGRYLAAASDVGGCLAMAFIEDEKLAELHRHYDSCAKEEEQQAAAGGRADATPADQRAPVVPQILPLQAFFINERAVMAVSLVWRPRRRMLPSSSVTSIHLLLGCSDGFIRVCAFVPQTLSKQQLQQDRQIQVMFPLLRLKSVTLARIACGMQNASVCDMVYVHLSNRRAVLIASCNATDLPADGSAPVAVSALAGDSSNSSSSNSSSSNSNSNGGGFYEVRVAEPTQEGLETVTEVLQRHADFIVGLAASSTGATIASLSVDGKLVVRTNRDALATTPPAATAIASNRTASSHRSEQSAASLAAQRGTPAAGEAPAQAEASMLSATGAEEAAAADTAVAERDAALSDLAKTATALEPAIQGAATACMEYFKATEYAVTAAASATHSAFKNFFSRYLMAMRQAGRHCGNKRLKELLAAIDRAAAAGASDTAVAAAARSPHTPGATARFLVSELLMGPVRDASYIPPVAAGVALVTRHSLFGTAGAAPGTVATFFAALALSHGLPTES